MGRCEAPRTTALSSVVAGLVAGSNILALFAMGFTPTQAHSPAPDLTRPDEQTASRTARPDLPYPTLGLGDRETTWTPVRATQYLLRRWAPNLATDGSFGYSTRAAVKSFQRAERLPVTGRLHTAADWRHLYLRNPVAFGSKGNAVAAAQIIMNLYWADDVGRVAVDGKFGPAMRAKVTAFQRHINSTTPGSLAVDGLVGTKTWNALQP